MQHQLVDKHSQSKIVYVFPYRQQRCHYSISSLHDSIWHHKPQKITAKTP